MRKRRKFFASAGEKRKFFNNVRHFGHTRDIGLACMGLMPMLGVFALVVLAAIAMAMLFSVRPGTEIAGFKHGRHLSMLTTGLGILGTVGMSKIREMRAARKKLVEDANALIFREGRTKEDNDKFDKMMADADVMLTDIERMEKAEEAAAQLRNAPPAGSPSSDPDDEPDDREIRDRQTAIQIVSGIHGISNEERSKLLAMIGSVASKQDKKYRAAFKNYLKHGLYPSERFRGVTEEERQILFKHRDQSIEARDMGTGGGNALQGSGGGFFVPVGFVYDVLEALKYYGPMLKAADILPTDTGQPLPYPTANDTAVVGELVGEAQQVSTNDVTLGNIVFNAWKYSTKMVKVSIELLQDSAFDLEAFLKKQFAIRLGRILNTHFTTGSGSGSSMPNGIITASTAGPTAIGSSGNTGGSETGGTSIGSDDLIELEHSVDILYREGASYMMHDSTLKKLKQIKDKFGRPLWLPGLAFKEPDTINSYPYWINNDMAAVAINNKTVLFGQMDKYLVRQVKELSILRLVERFADFGQVAFIGFARYDGNLLDAGTHPVKYLVQAAS